MIRALPIDPPRSVETVMRVAAPLALEAARPIALEAMTGRAAVHVHATSDGRVQTFGDPADLIVRDAVAGSGDGESVATAVHAVQRRFDLVDSASVLVVLSTGPDGAPPETIRQLLESLDTPGIDILVLSMEDS